MFRNKKINFFGTGTIGERGQIVVPAKARGSLNIKPGEKFIFFGHGSMIHMVKATELETILKAISQKFMGKTQEIKEILKKMKKENKQKFGIKKQYENHRG